MYQAKTDQSLVLYNVTSKISMRHNLIATKGLGSDNTTPLLFTLRIMNIHYFIFLVSFENQENICGPHVRSTTWN